MNSEQQPKGPLYSTKQVLDRLGIARRTLDRWLEEGAAGIKSEDVFRDWLKRLRFTQEQLDRLLKYKKRLTRPKDQNKTS